MSNRVIATMVTKFEFKGLGTKGLSQDLMTHTDAKDWLLAKYLFGIFHGIWSCRWVALQGKHK